MLQMVIRFFGSREKFSTNKRSATRVMTNSLFSNEKLIGMGKLGICMYKLIFLISHTMFCSALVRRTSCNE